MGWVVADDLHQRVAARLDDPTVVALAPGRVNLIGEHTDYNRGLCLPLALPHATWVAARPAAGATSVLRSAQADDTWEGLPGDGRHADGWAAYAAGVLWALAGEGFELAPVELYVDSTVPLGAGLSSSAALECSVATAALAVSGVDLDDELRARVARACMRAESEVAGAPTGGMDQLVSMFGRSDHALLLDFDDAPRRQVPLAVADADLALLVIDTRVSHALTDGGYASRRADCEKAARLVGLASLRAAGTEDLGRLEDPRVRARARHIVTEIDRVAATVASLERGDWPQVGELMTLSHASMRDDFEISCPELDLVVETAAGAGALGARMTGGGFGGSAVVLTPRGSVQDVAEAVTSAAARASYPEPGLLLAEPSAGARVL